MNQTANNIATSGVSGYSGVDSTNQYFIFSVGNDVLIEAQFRAWASENLNGFKSLYGRYKGVQERSFITNWQNFDRIKSAGWIDREETVLLLGPSDNRGARDSWLISVRPDSDYMHNKPMGKFWSVGKETAEGYDGYTFDPQTGQYFVCLGINNERAVA